MSTRHKKRRAWGMYAPGAVAVLLLSYSALHGVPGAVARDGLHMVATVVGASASVPVTPENTIAAQLAAREVSLNEREGVISERERLQALRERDVLPLASFIASIILALLVTVNFVLDYRRSRSYANRGVINLKQS